MKKILLKFKFEFILVLILALVSSMFNVLAGYQLSFLLNAAVNNSLLELFRSSILIIITWLSFLVFNALRKNRNYWLRCKINNELRENLAKNIFEMKNEEWIKQDFSKWLGSFTSNIEIIDNQVCESIFDLLFNAFSLLLSFVFLVKIHYTVGIIALVLFILISIIPRLFSKKLEDCSANIKSANELLTTKITNELTCRFEYVLYNMKELFSQKIVDSSKENEQIKYDYTKMSTFSMSIIQFASIFSQLILILVVALYSMYQICSVGDILSVGNLAGSFMNGSSSVISDMMLLLSNKHHVSSITSVVPEVHHSRKQVIQEIVVDNLTKISIGDYEVKYSKTKFKIENNEKILISGKSGSGKSTLMKSIFLYDLDYEGIIQINGVDRNTLSYFSWIDDISYIDQNVHIFEGSLFDNIVLEEKGDKDIVQLLIEQLDLMDLFKKCGCDINSPLLNNSNTLSGGERQKIALARALYSNRKTLILDESTSAIDSTSSNKILEYILSQKDLTVMLITHKIGDDLLNKFDDVIYID